MDFAFKVIVGVIGCACIALICLIVLFIAEMAVNGDKYDCTKTGRQTTTFIMAGKVMVPVVQDETVCKLRVGVK